MFQRKKIKDFFPNLTKELLKEKRIEARPTGKYGCPNIRKYEVVSSHSTDCNYKTLDYKTYQEAYHSTIRTDTVINFAQNAKVLAFEIDFNLQNQCIVTIDFNKNTNAFDELEQIKSVQGLLKPTEISVLGKNRLRNVDHLPGADQISYSATIAGADSWDKKRDMVDNIFLSIHKIDPFDIRIINILNASYACLGLNSTKQLIELEKFIFSKLNDANSRGNVMGLFAQAQLQNESGVQLPSELANEIGAYIDTPKDRLNVGLSCQAAAITGAAETQREADIINQNIFSMKP